MKNRRKQVKSDKVLPKDTTQEEIDRSLDALDGPKAEVLEVDGIEITEVPPDEPQPLQLTKDELHRLQLSQFQARAFEAEMKLEIFKRDLYLKQIDPQGLLAQMNALIRGRSNETAEAKTSYAAVVKQIEDRLKISLKDYAYDDLNGVLSRVDPGT